jgi:hypothetical protein
VQIGTRSLSSINRQQLDPGAHQLTETHSVLDRIHDTHTAAYTALSHITESRRESVLSRTHLGHVKSLCPISYRRGRDVDPNHSGASLSADQGIRLVQR